MPKSVSYHEHRIQFLKNPKYAAAFITAILEEEDPEPELIQSALADVAEALGKEKMTSGQAKQQDEKLNALLSQRGSDAIYNLGTWLNALGLKLTVTVCEEAKEQEVSITNNAEVKAMG